MLHLLISTKIGVQLRLMDMLVLPVFGHKAEYDTNLKN